MKGQREAEVGLTLEERGDLTGIIRDPTERAEFIELDGTKWDVKTFNFHFRPKQGGFTLQSSMDEIYESLNGEEYVILDTKDLSHENLKILLTECKKRSLMKYILVYP